jgi:hypothetical protein
MGKVKGYIHGQEYDCEWNDKGTLVEKKYDQVITTDGTLTVCGECGKECSSNFHINSYGFIYCNDCMIKFQPIKQPFVSTKEESSQELGTRYNKDKLRWRNIPMWLIRPLVEVGQMGEKKYSTFNFLRGLPVNDIFDSLKRHLDKLEDPKQSDCDDESKLNHAYHIAWNALVLGYMLENRPDLDDRWEGRVMEYQVGDKLKHVLSGLVVEVTAVSKKSFIVEYSNGTEVHVKKDEFCYYIKEEV